MGTSDEILEEMLASQRRLRARWDELQNDPDRWRARARTAELLDAVDSDMDALELTAEQWVEQDLPEVYRLGAGSTGPFNWTSAHRGAIAVFAADTFEEIRIAVDGVRADARRFARDAARAATRGALVEGRTAKQGAREFARELRRVKEITAVTYADGTRRTIGDYGDMLVRTKTALAYNLGTLNQLVDRRVAVVEIADGADCGLITHNDPQKAHGLILPITEAYAYPIAHPRCQRAFLPRPDLAPDAAGIYDRSSTDAQAADQARIDYFDPRSVNRRPAPASTRRPRSARSAPRAPRSTRGRRTARRPAETPIENVRTKPITEDEIITASFDEESRVLIRRIGEIHDMPDDGLPEVVVSRSARSNFSKPGKGGDFAADADQPTISIWDRRSNPKAPRSQQMFDDPDATFIHEWGHRMDFAPEIYDDIDDAGMLTLGETRGLGKASEEVQQAVRTFNEVTDAHVSSILSDPDISLADKRYLSSPAEVWARAYTQWIGEQLDDDAVSRAVQWMHTTTSAKHWTSDEFAPVGSAVAGILRARGLLR